jgi:hypothetical protein
LQVFGTMYSNQEVAGIYGDNLLGPHVLPNRLTGRNYKVFMQNSMLDFLANVPLIIYRELHLRYVRALAHYSLTARRYLNRKVPGQWICRSGPIAWPPRPPYLNTLDFPSCGHLKSFVCVSPLDDVEILRNRIVAGSQTIRNMPGIWGRLRVAMRHLAESCIQAGGGHIKHVSVR